MVWQDKYFEWMMETVCENRFSEKISFRKLLTLLNDIEFTYTIKNDVNRARDGVGLRRRFDLIAGRGFHNYGNKPCSVLEMMLALAIRCEESIMDDPRVGDRTAHWFWGMVASLGLADMTDDNFDEQLAVDRIYRFLNREYLPNGRGGLFTIRNRPQNDLRNVEIWMQLGWYLDNIIT